MIFRILTSLLLTTSPALADDGGFQREVEFSWGAVDAAQRYEIEFRSTLVKDGSGKIKTVSVKSNTWKGSLPVGKYQMKIRSYDPRGVPGGWSNPLDLKLVYPPVEPTSPKDKADIKSDEPVTTQVSLKWKAPDDNARYHVEVMNTKGKVIARKTTESTNADFDLKVSREYLWRVTARLPDGTSGETWQAPRSFRVLGGRLDPPEIDEDINPETPLVKWTKPKYARNYTVTLAHKDPKTGKWKPVYRKADHTDTKLEFEKHWPQGEYRIRLAAVAPMRTPSETAEHTFATGVSAAIRGKRSSSHELEGGYSWIPGIRAITISGPSANSALSSAVLNSHAVRVGWLYRREVFAFGLALQGHYQSSELFADKESIEGAENTEQQTIPMVTMDNRAMGRIGFGFWRVFANFYGGMGQRTYYRIYPEGLSAFEADKTTVAVALFGPSLEFLLNEGALIELTNMSGIATSKGTLDSYLFTEGSLGYRHQAIIEQLYLRYFAMASTTLAKYTIETTQETYESRWYQAMLGLSVIFLF